MIDQQSLEQLLNSERHEYTVSIYIPTHRAGVTELKQDKTRFKNQLDIAEADLKQLGVRAKQRTAQLKPGHELLRDEVFWRHQDHGLAAFLSPDSIVWYTLSQPVGEITVTARRHHLKPLLFLPESNTTFYILALSPASVRLFRADGETVTTIESAHIPADITEALTHKEREPTQQHTVTGGGGRGKAVFHGHGGLKDYKEIELKKFVHAVAKAVHQELHTTAAPLVFAGDEELFGLYRAESRTATVLDSFLKGNHDDTSEHDLYTAAQPLVEVYFQDNPSPVLDSFYHLRTREPEHVSNELPSIIGYAGEGRVAELLLAADTTVWGNVAPDYSVEKLSGREQGAVDLLDVAAAETYRHGGNIHQVAPDSIPDGATAAAILRY